MKKFSVFYHIWAPEGSGAWCLLIDEQIKSLVSSGLKYNSNIYCCISSPEHERIQEFMKNYPFVEILDSSSDTRQYEAFTLKHVYEYCCNSGDKHCDGVMYFHTKGIRHFSNQSEFSVIRNANSWRKFLEFGTITKWRECVTALRNYDVSGINYHLSPRCHFQGNFWWARPEYIASLEHPLSRRFADESFCHPEQIDRVSCEMWVGSGEPKWFSLYNYPFRLDGNFESTDLYNNDIFPHYEHNSF